MRPDWYWLWLRFWHGLRMANPPIRFEVERDPKDNLRFFVTFPDNSLPKNGFRPLNLDIADAEAILKSVKKTRAAEGLNTVAKSPVGQWLNAHARPRASAKPYSVSRKSAGTTPAHWRIGAVITFADPTIAQAFATFCRIP